MVTLNQKRLIQNQANGEIKRIYPEEPQTIVKPKIEQKMEVSQNLYSIGIKDIIVSEKEKVKRHIAIEIILNVLFGKSSKLYKQLYNDGSIFGTPSLDYEFTSQYAHAIISGQSNQPDKVYERFKSEAKQIIENGLNKEDFERIKKKIYGLYVKDYNDVEDIAKMFLSDYFKGINSFDYLEQMDIVNIDYANQVAKELFDSNKMVLSVITK